jgi:hypothetical protein
MSLTQVVSGVQQVGDSATITTRADKQGAVCVTELNARYYEHTYRGRGFSVAIQAVATTTVGLATTYTGLCLANPTKSNANLVLTKLSMMQSVAQATQPEAYAIAFGFNNTTEVTLTAAATVQSTLIGSGGLPQAKAATSATLPTAPLYGYFVGATSTATANPTGNTPDLEGSWILPPGGYACWVTPAQASVAGLWFSFSWIEVPV